MANDVIISKGEGGLGRQATGKDHISGLAIYSDSTPSGFTSVKVHNIFSLEQAEALGVTDQSTDATAATATSQQTLVGADGDKITVTVAGLEIGVATVPAAPTVDLQATAIADAINDGQYETGYTAVAVTDTVTISAPKSSGEGINTFLPVVAHTGAGTSTEVAFSGGVGSEIDVMHYHVSEYFRMQPNGNLYLGVFAEPTTFDFSEVSDMQTVTAKGEIRQCGIYQIKDAFSTVQCDSLQAVYNALFTLHQPMQMFLQAEISGTTDLSTLPNLQALSDENVSVVIAQDGNAKGSELYTALGKSVGAVGNFLGMNSLVPVQRSVGWVAAYNLALGTELQVPAYANSTLLESVPQAQQDNLAVSKSYTSFVEYIGVDGTYWQDSPTAVVATSDYHFTQNNRVIDKAGRDVRTNLLPLLMSDLVVNDDGTLNAETVFTFEAAARFPLQAIQTAQEISGFKVTIDPAQNVLATSRVEVGCLIVPIGTTREIFVPLSFALKIS